MAKAKGRAMHFQDPDEHITRDYDPEANAPASDGGSDDASENENAGTEHYVSVGKSKLRQKEGVSLGPEYRGSRVSRSALEDSEDDDDGEEEEDEGGDESDYNDSSDCDDPETADPVADEARANDSEIDSENALAESDAERFDGFVFRGSSKPAKPNAKASRRVTAANYMSSDDGEDGVGGVEVNKIDSGSVEQDDSDDSDVDDGLDSLANGGDSEGSEEAGEEADQGSEDEENGSENGGSGSDKDKSTRTKEHSASPRMEAHSNRAEVDKGIAIQQQRKIYDGLLNLRIRLQKALVAANTFPTMEARSDMGLEPYEAAEEAAIKLLDTISSLRESLGESSRAGNKRKRQLLPSTASETIWEQMQEEDLQSAKFRQDRLEKWWRKVQSVTVAPRRGLNQRDKTIVEVLEEQLANPESRLVKRTRVPRSCAPVQAANKVAEDSDVYDDADFYQLLLKELVDQRTVEASAAPTGAVPTVMLTAAKEAKTRKQVDRKASKGRKMRFTVHEKLQNFMAPEDRRTWEQGAIDRFFGSLFGRKMELNEDESEDEEMGGLDAEEEGLRLFRG